MGAERIALVGFLPHTLGAGAATLGGAGAGAGAASFFAGDAGAALDAAAAFSGVTFLGGCSVLSPLEGVGVHDEADACNV